MNPSFLGWGFLQETDQIQVRCMFYLLVSLYLQAIPMFVRSHYLLTITSESPSFGDSFIFSPWHIQVVVGQSPSFHGTWPNTSFHVMHHFSSWVDRMVAFFPWFSALTGFGSVSWASTCPHQRNSEFCCRNLCFLVTTVTRLRAMALWSVPSVAWRSRVSRGPMGDTLEPTRMVV